jgi:hypothetical protein
MGANQCGVPGCDRRSNTNPKCNSHSNVYSNALRHCHAKAHSFTKASSDTKAQADSAAKTLIPLQRQQAKRDKGFLGGINVFRHRPIREKIAE